MRKKYNSDAIADFLSHTFLFANVSIAKISELCDENCVFLKSYVAGEYIYSPHDFDKNIGFVMSGECVVERAKKDSSSIPLNKLNKFDSFGVLSAFSEKTNFPTYVKARKASTVLFIEKDDVLRLIGADSQLAINIITFMANRIDFLNSKISTFSADNVEQKLANYILCECKSRAASMFDFNCKRASESINSGRASLYRAIDSLTQKNILKLENKKIIILDLEGLERILQ